MIMTTMLWIYILLLLNNIIGIKSINQLDVICNLFVVAIIADKKSIY
jgi:hypothetical protein